MDDGYTTDDWAVTGEAGAWVVEFKGALGGAPRALLVGDGTSLTGGGGVVKTVTVATTVAGVTAASSAVTTAITFSPALGAGNYSTDAAITFLPQQLEVKIGEGNITYTEHNEYDYLLDRDNLDTVKEGKEVPMDVKWDSVYEHITTGTSENISPMDALKGIGAASEWISYAADPCEPYCCGHGSRARSALWHEPGRNHALPRFPLGAAGSELQGCHDLGHGQVQRHGTHREPSVRRLPGP